MTLFDSMCLRPVGCTLDAVAQSELEAITMGTGGWEVLGGGRDVKTVYKVKEGSMYYM